MTEMVGHALDRVLGRVDGERGGRLGRATIGRDGEVLLGAREARRFLERLRGLHELPPLGAEEALVIRPCRAVQTFGMDEPIEVAFVDAKGVIRKLVPLPPGRLAWCPRARASVELAAGTIERLGLACGQRLTLSSGGWGKSMYER